MELQHPPRRYLLDAGVEVYPAGEELIAVHTGKDEIHRLNPAAALILHACDGRSSEEIAAQLHESYPEVPRGQIDEDVERTLSLLTEKGVIRLLRAGEDS